MIFDASIGHVSAMDDGGIVNVKWSAFQQHIQDSRKELFETKNYCDVTLVSKDMKKFTADKAIIGPASGLLKKIFLSKKDPKLTILLKDIMDVELAAVLQFVYLGETIIEESRINQLRAATKILQIVGMENQPPGVMDSTKNPQQAPLMKPLLDQESKNLMNFLSLEKNDETKINSLIFEPDPTPQNDDQNNSANSLDSGNTDFKYVDVGNKSKGKLGLLKTTILTRPPRGTQLEKLIGNPNTDSECGESIKKEESELQVKAKATQLKKDNEVFKFQMDVDGKEARFYKGVNIEGRTDCPDCKNVFANPNSLRDHIGYKHIGIKFDCHLCDYRATKKASLKLHVQSMHLGILFPCNYCDYKNAKKARLDLHILNKHSNLLSPAKVKSLNDQDLIQKRHKTNQRQRERKRERNSFNLKRENIEKLMEIKPIPVNMGSTKSVVFNSELFSLFNTF